MRFKFRAWHTAAGEMVYDYQPGDVFKWKNERQPLEIMQWTGLKDKNGTEIYEGDIVANHNPRCWGHEVLVVRWQEPEVELSSDGIEWLKEKPGFRFQRVNKGMTTVFVPHKHFEVIGNIHQNPELLEVTA